MRLALVLAGCRGGDAPGPLPGPVPSGAPATTAETTASAPAANVAASAPVAVPSPPASASAAAAPSSAPAGMVEIPAGFFLMGTRAGQGSPEEHPMHEVAVASFYLDRTEVTTRDYVACMSKGACTKPHEDNPFCNTPHAAERGDHPINCIDWAQADAYCHFAEKRLPSEREWEYAARGGAELRTYSWGEEPPTPQRSCYLHLGTCPVGSFAPGAFGLVDVSGNVWEWTSSWFGNYPHEPRAGKYRIYRGGSWSRRFPKWLANGLRNRYLPEESSASVGVRCAKSREPLVCPPDAEPKDGACARARGTPACEPTYAWNGDACTPGGTPSLKAAAGAAPPAATDAPAAVPPEDTPITKVRTPQFDDDCKAHWPKTPAAYRFSGSTFHKRNGPILAGGCSKRDMGQTWTSACCPG